MRDAVTQLFQRHMTMILELEVVPVIWASHVHIRAGTRY